MNSMLSFFSISVSRYLSASRTLIRFSSSKVIEILSVIRYFVVLDLLFFFFENQQLIILNRFLRNLVIFFLKMMIWNIMYMRFNRKSAKSNLFNRTKKKTVFFPLFKSFIYLFLHFYHMHILASRINFLNDENFLWHTFTKSLEIHFINRKVFAHFEKLLKHVIALKRTIKIIKKKCN